MAKMKTTKKYYFTVEGETEKWYLDWLKDKINECEEAAYKVTFDVHVEKNPLKRAKNITVVKKTEIGHLSVYTVHRDIYRKLKTTDRFICKI